jgi:hypothetical protein
VTLISATTVMLMSCGGFVAEDGVGVVCENVADCAIGLECLEVGTTQRCTASCETDEDCDIVWSRAYCTSEGVCDWKYK